MAVGWGIGSYRYTNEDGEDDFGYGFPWGGMNPHDFHPDHECCTPEEIAQWEKDKADNPKPTEGSQEGKDG